MKRAAVVFTLLSFVCCTWLIFACGGGGGGGGEISLGPVQPLYPLSGADWNDYVKNDGANIFTASGTAATGTETGGYSAVLHAGEMRAVSVSGTSDCTGLTASDSLGAFRWVCDESTDPVRMVSIGLEDDVLLSDLVDFNMFSWRANAVTVWKDGSVFGVTEDSAWWSNPIYEDNDGGNLTTAGAVYLVTSGGTVSQYIFAADRIALVIKPGETLVAPTLNPLVAAVLRKFVWFEGTLDMNGGYQGFVANPMDFSVIRGASVYNAQYHGFEIQGSTGLRLSHVSGNNGDGSGLLISNNTGCLVTDLFVSNFLYGLNISSSRGIVIRDATLSNNVLGAWLHSTANNILAGVTAMNNSNGIWLQTGINNVFVDLTAANNESRGILLSDGSHYNTLMNVAVANNHEGIRINSGNYNTVANAAAVNNSYSGITLSGTTSDYFTGVLKVGGDGFYDCLVSGGTNEGLQDGTCLNAGISDAVLTTAVDASVSFVGKVTSDDAVNLSDDNGAAFYLSVDDWTRFENRFRGWGRDGQAFPSLTHQGMADSTQTVRIWDWSLASGDTGDGGGPVLLDALPSPDGDDILAHMFDGSVTVTTFMRNAVELIGDGAGNDNLLCESGEDCQYTPDIGSYQGHGGLVDLGPAPDGTITGVTLKEMSINGY